MEVREAEVGKSDDESRITHYVFVEVLADEVEEEMVEERQPPTAAGEAAMDQNKGLGAAAGGDIV